MTTNKTGEIGSSDDAALINSAKQGNMAAFEELIKHHTTMISRIAMHLVGSREDAEDVVQDAFLKAFQRLHDFEERARFSTWLTRIAVNEALTKLRRSQRSYTSSIDDEVGEGMSLGDTIADWRPNPEQDYSASELKELLQEALTSLPDHYRAVFLLRDVEGISIADTAEMLELSVSSVKSRLLNARLKLRQSLSKYFARGGMGVKPSLALERGLNDSLAMPAAI
jgi:RNA polymerase sigma-70 factor (ECF subfamily)